MNSKNLTQAKYKTKNLKEKPNKMLKKLKIKRKNNKLF